MRLSLNLFFVLAVFIIFTPAFAQQNSLATEVTPTAEPEEAEPTPVKATSVDLKEVVDSPEIAPAIEPAPVEMVAEPIESNKAETPTEGAKDSKAVDSIEEAINKTPIASSESKREELTEDPDDPEDVSDAPINDAIAEEAGLLEPQITKIPEPPVLGEVNKDLVLLNSAVAPGTAARLSWMPGAGFISSPTPVLVVNGAKPGPSLCLTAAVHGDELNGIEIVRHILYNLDPENLSGAVIGIPIVNLQGFQRSSRYLSDRRDLNRYFPGREKGSAAARMAHSLFTEVILHCDYLVDLHTGSFRRTNLPQLRADLSYPAVANLAKKMGAIVVLQSRGHPGSLRNAAVRSGIPTVTMELGQPLQLQKDIIEHGIKSVDNLIDSLGMEKRLGFFSLKPEPVYYQSQWIRAGSGGILFSNVQLGERISKGTVLGVITDPITNVRQKIKSPHAGRVIGMALNQVMYPGFAAYHIGLQSSAEEAAEVENSTSEDLEDDDETPVFSGNIDQPIEVIEDPDPRMQEDSE